MDKRLALLACTLLVGCGDCSDRADGWDLNETFDSGGFRTPGLDLGFTIPDATIDPPDEGGAVLDLGWMPEPVVPSVPAQRALNDRTALAVDDDGTIWLGYHACNNPNCSDVDLALAYKERGGVWQFERVKPQDGTFGIDVAIAGQPVSAFLDPTDDTFKAAVRVAPNQYEFHTFPVARTSVSDGLDIARDGDRVFITFANTQGDPVSLFVYSRGEYRPLANLDIGNAQAALERGLRADGRGNLFLLHRRGRNQDWGVARYRLEAGTWDARTYYTPEYDPQHPSSLVVTTEGDVCISGDQNTQLALTCGDMEGLTAKTIEVYDGEFFNGYSSMVQGTDGTLYVAYNNLDNDLRLAKLRTDGSTEIETVFVGETYGVSTAIDKDNLLVISYYTCAAGNCRLEVLSRPQN